MRVLLTGAAGFIGSHVAERLLSRGDEIVAIDNFDETLYPAAVHEENLAHVRTHARAGALQFVRGDILDADAVSALLDGGRVDAVVHLAALAGVRPSLREPLRYSKVNVDGTVILLEAMRARAMRRLVFASSSSVYGVRNEVPFRESDPAVHPASPYAATKRAGELLCDLYASIAGMTVASLRFFTVYGPRQRPEMAIHLFARSILDGRPVQVFGDGETARDYTYIDDIVDGVVAALDSTAPGGTTEGHRVYNLGGARTTTLKRLVELLEGALGTRAIIDRQPDQLGDVPLTCADVTNASGALGYSPRVTIEEGINRFCGWLRASRGAGAKLTE